MSNPLLLVGVVGSPYSRKMRGVLRYRRIPFQWLNQGSDVQADLPKSPLPLLPILYYPSETGEPAQAGYEATSDSTFMLRRLEGTFKGRSIVPSDPVMALLDFLIEAGRQTLQVKPDDQPADTLPGEAAPPSLPVGARDDINRPAY